METILITGANGEVGHGLIHKLRPKYDRSLTDKTLPAQARESSKLIALDLNALDKSLTPSIDKFYKGSVTDKDLVGKIFRENKIDTIFHLAAILSTTGEKNPSLAHEVNVNGTINLLDNCVQQKHKIKFIFPSSIAVYGIPTLKIKKSKLKIREDGFLNPITMYGINKLYCEHLSTYYSTHFSSPTTHYSNIDFRCLRFPGLISAETIPTGGTSDYIPEMIHHAAQGKPYKCFVRPNTQIPFMAMPDAIEALIKLESAPKEKLNHVVYNVTSFSITAKESEKLVKKSFRDAKITYKVDKKRQKIVDSWPADINDSKARKDWDWKPKYNFEKTFTKYLIPKIKKKYEVKDKK